MQFYVQTYTSFENNFVIKRAEKNVSGRWKGEHIYII